jgi:hypothetical protein
MFARSGGARNQGTSLVPARTILPARPIANPPDCESPRGTGWTRPLREPQVQRKNEIRQHILMTTILLLTLSNIFMTFAWYGHLKYRHAPLFKVIVVSWLIAFAEYCFQVPANRIGSYQFSVAQLKTIQEVITLTVFSIFSVLYLREPLKWNYLVGFVMIVGAVAVIFKKW